MNGVLLVGDGSPFFYVEPAGKGRLLIYMGS